jgi:YD repeat-containing protein
MKKERVCFWLASLLLLVALTLPPQPVLAQDAAWRSEFYNNPNLTGAPALIRTDAAINFDWGWGASAAGIPADHFSVRWSRTVRFDAGVYRFYARVDDGVRVFVDGDLLIDQWRITAPATYTADVRLAAGDHHVRVEYFEATQQAVAAVRWERIGGQPASPPSNDKSGWRGEYYDNAVLAGGPRLIRTDADLRFDWGAGSPGSEIPRDQFSARWTRGIHFDGGQYRFTITADDGVRVWLDDRLIIDRWTVTSVQTHQVLLKVDGGWHNVRVEYFEAGGLAAVTLRWARTDVNWVGNLKTCIRPSNSWLKVYRRMPDGQWHDLNAHGWGPLSPDGRLKIDGLPVEPTFGLAGQPYRVEVWAAGSLIRSVGNTDAGQPEWRFRPQMDNQTPWGCPP